MIKIIKSAGLTLTVLLLSACGSNSDTSDNGTHSLAKLQSTALGVVYYGDLTGSDSNGATDFGGSITISNKAQTEFSGVMVTPRYITISVQGIFLVYGDVGELFIDDSGYILSLTQNGTLCTPATLTRFPETVKIGDEAMLSVFSCNNSIISIELSWKTEDAGNGNINFIITKTYSNSETALFLSSTQSSYTINTSGNIVEFSAIFNTNDGYTLHYSTNPLAPKVPVN